MNLLITNQNKKNDEVMGEVIAHKAEILAQQDLLKIQQDKATRALDEPRDFNSRLSALTQQIQLLGQDAQNAIDKVEADAPMIKADIIKEFEFRNVEITKWFNEFKDKSGPPGFGGGDRAARSARAAKPR